MKCLPALVFLILDVLAFPFPPFLLPPGPPPFPPPVLPILAMRARERFLDRVASRQQSQLSQSQSQNGAAASRQPSPSPTNTCPSLRERLHSKTLLKPCCDGIIKNVVERGMKTLDLFGTNGPKTLGPLLQAIHKFVQNHFKTAYEIIMAPKDFHIKTNYNGTKMCKFESNHYFLAVYETPGYYDINSPRESFFSKFATNDKLRLPMIASHIQERLKEHRLGSNIMG